MISHFETAIINRIKVILNVANIEAKLEPYPSNPEVYNVSSGMPTVLVRYGGKVFQSPPNRQFVSQTLTIEYDVFVLFKSLVGAGEGYEILEVISDGLIGYDIDKDLRVYQFSEEILSERSESTGFWIYQQRYGVDVIHRAK